MKDLETIADMLKANVDNKKLSDEEFRGFCKTLVDDYELSVEK